MCTLTLGGWQGGASYSPPWREMAPANPFRRNDPATEQERLRLLRLGEAYLRERRQEQEWEEEERRQREQTAPPAPASASSIRDRVAWAAGSDLAGWLRTLAPLDLASTPVYCVWDSQLPGGVRLDPGTAAMTSRDLSHVLRPHLPASAWQGPGVAMLLSARHHPPGEDSLTGDIVRRAQMMAWGRARALHELAHALAGPPPHYQVEVRPDTPTAERWVSSGPAASPSGCVQRRLPTWHHHNIRWLRATMHLHWRAETAGQPISWADTIPHVAYGLSDPREYVEVLGVEAYVCRGRRMPDILARPYPSAFAALWRRDTGTDPT